VNHLGLKDVAWVLDISGSQLSDAVNERDRKRWAGEWLDVVKQMLLQRHDEIAIDIYRRLVELDTANSPFVVVDDDVMCPEEEAAALKRELMKFGDAGRAVVERYRKRRKR
jgi:hypothetical protein